MVATDSSLDQLDMSTAIGASSLSKHTPLHRDLSVGFRSTLNELCSIKTKATWAPTQQKLENMLKQNQFTRLDGTAAKQGDLSVR
tara:strand:- start:383 stop:637 length:255 start_codon:yes stop_codon:yes gene_type:complete